MAYLGNRPVSGDNNSFRVLDDIKTHTFSFDGSSSSVVSTSDNTITHKGHRLIQGQRVTYTDGTGSPIGGLTDGTVYFVVINDANSFKLASSASNAAAGTGINLSGLGSGTAHNITVAFDGVNTKFKATFNNGTEADVTRVAQIQISLNNVIQQPQNTATPTSGFGFDSDSVIVFATAPASNVTFWGVLFANNFPTFEISDNDVDSFTGNGSTTEFSLSKSPATNENIIVTIDGVVQYPSDNSTTRAYNTVGNALQFSAAPADGADIQARHIGFAGPDPSVAGVTAFYGRTGSVFLNNSDNIVVNDAEVTGNLTVQGSMTTLDTKVTEVDQLEVAANNTTVGVAITQSGSGDILNLYDGSTEVFTVEDGGNVGIGTDNPGSLLHLQGTGGNTSGLTLKNSAGKNVTFYLNNNTSSSQFSINSGGTGGSDIQIHNDGNVFLAPNQTGNIGIGTYTAESRLQVNGDVKITGIVTASSFSGSGDLDIDGQTDLDDLAVSGISTFSGDIKIETSDLSKSLQIGNIAGTPVNYLGIQQVSGSSIKGFATQHSNASVFENLQGSIHQHLVLGDSENNNTGTLFGISITQSGTTYERLKLTGVGDLTVARDLNVTRTLSVAQNIVHTGDTDTKIEFDTNTITFDTAGDERLRIKSDGNILVGTSTWQYPKALNVQGSSGSIISLSNFDTTTYAANTHAGIEFLLKTGNTGTTQAICHIQAFKENGTNGDSARALSFYTGINGGSPTERLRITSDGEVRIANGGKLTIKTDAVATYGVSEALRIDDSNVVNDRALQIFEYQNAGARWFSFNQNLNVTTTGTSYTYTQGNYSGSNMIEMNSGDLKIYSDPSIVGGGTSAITPTERVSILNNGKVNISGDLDVDGHTELDNLNVAGISTFSDDTHFKDTVRFQDASGSSKVNFFTFGRLQFNDNVQAAFGNSSQGRMGSDGSDLTISNNAGGSYTGTGNIKIQADAGKESIVGIQSGAVELYHNDVKRLETTDTGVSITDNLNVAGISTFTGRIDASDNIAITSGNRLYFGNSDVAFVKGVHGGSGYLALGANNEHVRITRAGEVGIGTDDPTQKLEVKYGEAWIDNNSGDSIARSDGLTVSHLPNSDFAVASDPGDSKRAATFAVKGTSRAAVVTLRNIDDNSAFWDFIADGNTNKFYIQRGGTSGAALGPAVSIDTSLNVGIGTNNTAHARLRIHRDGLDQMLQQWGGKQGSNAGQRFMQLYSPEIDNGNDYFRFQTGNAFKFQVDNTDSLCIRSDSNVGIGTDGPQTLLHLKSDDPTLRIQRYNQSAYADITADTAGKITFKSDPGGSASSDGFSFTIDNSEKLSINSSGKVGINQSTPTSLLTIKDETGGQSLLIEGAGGNDVVVLGSVNGATNRGELILKEGTTQQQLVKFTSKASTPSYIMNNNLGIGTQNPQTKLHITQGVDDKTDGIRLSRLNNAASYSQYIDTSARFNIGYSNPSTADPDPQITLDQNGKVGIGTDSPSELLDVYKPSNDAVIKVRTTTAGAYFVADSASSGYYGLSLSSSGTDKWFLGSYNSANFQIKAGSGNAGDEIFTIKTNGAIGIGTNNPNRGPLHIHQKSTGDSQIHLTNETTGVTSTDGFTIFAGQSNGDCGFVNRESGGALEFYTNDGSSLAERLRIASDGVLTAQKSASFGNTSDSFTAVQITSSTSGISELRFGDTTANAGYVKYEHSNNALILATNATERLRLESNGNLIAKSATQYKGFTLRKADGGTVAQLVGHGSDNDEGGLNLWDGGAKKVQILANGSSYLNGGRVGIGTNAAGTTLDVFGFLQVKDSTGKLSMQVDGANGVFKVFQSPAGWTNLTYNPNPILAWDFKSGPGDLMYMASGGNTPTADQMALVISDNHGFKVGKSGYDNNDFDVSSSDEFFRVDTSGNLTLTGKTGNSSPRFTIRHNNADVEGEVIRFARTELPAIRYHSIKARHSGNSSLNYISVNVHDGGGSPYTGQTEVARFLGSGKVGIGTDTPSDGAKLEVFARGDTERGIYITDSDNIHNSPYLRVLGKRNDGNTHQSFSGRILLASLRTDAKVNSGRKVGVIMFGGNHTNTSESNILYAASIAGIAGDSFDSATDMHTDLAFYTGNTGRTPNANNVSSGEERLRIKSTGVVTMPYQVAFFAHCTIGNHDLDPGDKFQFNSIPSSGKISVNSNHTTFNGTNVFNTSTNTFTAPVAGLYQFTVTAYYRRTGDPLGPLVPRVNNGEVSNGNNNVMFFANSNPTDGDTMSGTLYLQLAANDAVTVHRRNHGSGTVRFYGPHSHFCGHLIG